MADGGCQPKARGSALAAWRGPVSYAQDRPAAPQRSRRQSVPPPLAEDEGKEPRRHGRMADNHDGASQWNVCAVYGMRRRTRSTGHGCGIPSRRTSADRDPDRAARRMRTSPRHACAYADPNQSHPEDTQIKSLYLRCLGGISQEQQGVLQQEKPAPGALLHGCCIAVILSSRSLCWGLAGFCLHNF
jgi:hypothetical protein